VNDYLPPCLGHRQHDRPNSGYRTAPRSPHHDASYTTLEAGLPRSIRYELSRRLRNAETVDQAAHIIWHGRLDHNFLVGQRMIKR